MNILTYHVYALRGEWLAELRVIAGKARRLWTSRLNEAATFTTAEAARVAADDGNYIVAIIDPRNLEASA